MKKLTLLDLLTALLLLISIPTLAQKRVACIGDSVTEGVGVEDPEHESYPARLQELLGEGYEVRNFGYSGATLLRKGHSPYEQTPDFKEALAYPADIAVIHLGLNDTDPRNFPHYRDDFRRDYVWLIDTLRRHHPNMEIYVCSLTPIFTGHWRFTSSTKDWYDLLQEEIPYVVAARNTHFIDLNEGLRHRPDLVTDAPTLHPNAAGALEIARIVARTLTRDYGGLKVHGAWGDGMVLQQESQVTMRGTADTGSTVVLALDGVQEQAQEVGEDGKWAFSWRTGKASFTPHEVQVSDGRQSYTYSDLLIGEVWLALGQSNMDFPLRSTDGAEALQEKYADVEGIRLMKLYPAAETNDVQWSAEVLKRANELDFYQSRWIKNGTEAVRDFSGVGYTFATKLQEELGVPVGILQLAVGGSPLMAWVKRKTLEQAGGYDHAFVNWRKKDFIMRWCRGRADKNLGEGASPYQRHPYDPSFIQEAGMVQLLGLPVAGALWYQGESDAENAEAYERMFPLFLGDLRQDFGEIPLLTVQLSSLERTVFPRFRDTQRRLADRHPSVSLVTCYDYGKHGDVHTPFKIPVGVRLADLALQSHYGRALSYAADAPMADALEKQGAQVVVRFRDSRGQLATLDGQAVRGFVGKTLEGRFVPLQAEISKSGREVVLTLPGEGTVVTDIAYAFDPYTDANLCYAGGQPASTFIKTLEP